MKPIRGVTLFWGLALLLAACGGGGGSGSSSTPANPAAPTPPPAAATPPPSSAGPTPVTITITGQNGARSFSPNPATAAGQPVVFRNSDTVVHRVVLNDGSIDTGDIAPGATSRTVTMPTAGTNYHCSLHPGMIGAVSSATEPPPACTGPYCEGY